METDRALRTRAPIAAGCEAFGVSPSQAARYRERLGVSNFAAPRRLTNPLGGIPPGHLKPRTPYDKATAWSHHLTKAAA